MDLPKVTSLADLEFKAKENKYYRQLTAIVANYLQSYNISSIRGKPVSDEKYKTYIELLHNNAVVVGDCKSVCSLLNTMITFVDYESDESDETNNSFKFFSYKCNYNYTWNTDYTTEWICA